MHGHEFGADEPPLPFWTREEVTALVPRSGNPAETLTNVVQLIHRQFATDVCSAYPHVGVALQRRSHGDRLRVGRIHPRGGRHQLRRVPGELLN